MHVRTQIRKAVALALQQGVAAAEGRVYASRTYPYAVLPAIGVWSLTEAVVEDLGTFGSASIEFRELLLQIEARERADTRNFPDDKLDDLTASIEPIMDGDVTWGGIAHTTEYIRGEFVLDAETEQPAGVARLTYRVVYRINPSNPDQPLA